MLPLDLLIYLTEIQRVRYPEVNVLERYVIEHRFTIYQLSVIIMIVNNHFQ